MRQATLQTFRSSWPGCVATTRAPCVLQQPLQSVGGGMMWKTLLRAILSGCWIFMSLNISRCSGTWNVSVLSFVTFSVLQYSAWVDAQDCIRRVRQVRRWSTVMASPRGPIAETRFWFCWVCYRLSKPVFCTSGPFITIISFDLCCLPPWVCIGAEEVAEPLHQLKMKGEELTNQQKFESIFHKFR